MVPVRSIWRKLYKDNRDAVFITIYSPKPVSPSCARTCPRPPRDGCVFLNPPFPALPRQATPGRSHPRKGRCAVPGAAGSLLLVPAHPCRTGQDRDVPGQLVAPSPTHSRRHTHVQDALVPSGNRFCVVRLSRPFRLVRPRAACPQGGLKTLAGALFHSTRAQPGSCRSSGQANPYRLR